MLPSKLSSLPFIHLFDCAYVSFLRIWGSYSETIYDLTDYVWSLGLTQNSPLFEFLDADLVSVFKQRSGQDVTMALDTVLATMNSTYKAQHMSCLNNAFLVGSVDFRKTARCQVQNWLLIFFSALLMASIALKCLSSFFSSLDVKSVN
jgi:chitin synthase